MVVLAVELRKPRIGAKAKGSASEQTRCMFYSKPRSLKKCDLGIDFGNRKEMILRSFEGKGSCAATAYERLRQRMKKVQVLEKV